MSIETILAYKIGESIFQTVEEAQWQMLSNLLDGREEGNTPELILKHSKEVMEILSWNGESMAPAKKTRKTRKDKGTKRSEVKPAVVEGSGKYEGK